MLKSMTGYGRSEKEDGTGKVVVEISSTNRRYLEIQLNLPRELTFLERPLKDLLSQYVKRGRIQVHLEYQSKSGDLDLFVDVEMAKKYAEALQMLCDELNLEEDITLRDIISNKDVFSINKTQLNGEEIQKVVQETVRMALDEFIKIRSQEGETLQQDIIKRLRMIEIKVREIECLAPLAVERYEARLKKKLADLFADQDANEEKVMREAAVMAEKLDITEEVVRLNSHFQQFVNSMDSNDTVGRLLDFIVQEMFREINTIASKSSEMDISRLSVEVRNELDKIREQIQNIE